MLGNLLKCIGQLSEDNRLGLHAVHDPEPGVIHWNGHGHRRTGGRGKHRIKNNRADGIGAASDVERKLRDQLTNAATPGPLPLRPDQTKRGIRLARRSW